MLPTLLLLVAAASWGGNWVAARWVTADVPPFALAFWRWALASAVLLPGGIRPGARRRGAHGGTLA
jgi:drug/metabolite transporter (DMT)-like permease